MKNSLVVDAGNSPAHANEFLTDVSKLDIPPVKYLVLTHWHWDHVFGIKAMNLITVCNNRTKENLDKMQNLTWDDSTIYIPDEKTIFLGDCICEDIYSGEWSYSRDKLLPMINKIKKYDALYYLTSHHHPESKEEFFNYLNDLIRIGDFVGNDYIENEVIERYAQFYNKDPNKDEMFNICSFIHGNMKDRTLNE